jgi:hypothetical protein
VEFLQSGFLGSMSEMNYCSCINPKRTKSASEIPRLRETVIKYNLEDYFGIDVQMKVIDLEFLILSIRLDSPMLS